MDSGAPTASNDYATSMSPALWEQIRQLINEEISKRIISCREMSEKEFHDSTEDYGV